MSSTTLNINEGQEITSSVAMSVALISFSMLFASMLMGYAVFRLNAPAWPPMGMSKPDSFQPALSTAIITLSSLSYIFFEKKGSKLFLWVSFLCGLGFMASQFAFWNSLKASGFYVQDGIFPSLLYAFTWVHAAHIVGALGFLGWLLIRFEKLKCSVLWIRNVGKFWHFLGIIWFILYLTLFIL